MSVLTTKIQIGSSGFLVYKQCLEVKKKMKSARLFPNSVRKKYSGETTVNTVRRIRRACTCLDLISKWKIIDNECTGTKQHIRLTFITLTIPSNDLIPHKTAYKNLLKPFIRQMREKHGMTDYIWKAELQKRGQIHYHITTNIYCYWKNIKDLWNQINFKAGYMTQYISKHGHYNANSTDIHKVYNEKQISKYLEKYICKKDKEGRKIDGKIWDCSQNLKGKKLFSVEMQPHHLQNIARMENDQIEDYYVSDYFTKVQCRDSGYISQLLYGYEHHLFDEWSKSFGP